MKRTLSYHKRLGIIGFLFFLPALVLLLVFTVTPVISAMALSLTDYRLLTGPRFVGIQNYIHIFSDEQFWFSLMITFKYVGIRVALILILSVFTAFVLNKKSKYRTFLQILYILPFLFPLAATSMIWRIIYRPFGLMEGFLSFFGVPPVPWLASGDHALWAIIITTVWSGLGYFSVIMLAGVQTLSTEVIEASVVDGANRIQRFFLVIIPMLKPTLFYLLFISIVASLQGYPPFLMMTGGGPGSATLVLGLRIYEHGFVQLRMGYACAVTVILLVVIVIITGIQRSFLRYEGES